jgi:hypothetical protein
MNAKAEQTREKKLYAAARAVEASVQDQGETIRYAVYGALQSIRVSENKIRDAQKWMRGNLDDADRSFKAGYALTQNVAQHANDFEAAAAVYNAAFEMLAALVGKETLAAFITACTLARDPEAHACNPTCDPANCDVAHADEFGRVRGQCPLHGEQQ